MGEHLVLAHQSSSAAMSDHEAGVQTATLLHGQEGIQSSQRGVHQTLQTALRDVGDLVDGDGQVVEGLRGVLAMEVASRDDDGLAIVVAEDHGVVRGAVQLGGEDVAHEGDGVVHDAMHLRSAAQRVRVLDLLLVGQLLEDLALVQVVVQAGAHALSHGTLALVLARIVDEVAVGCRGAAKSLEGHAADHIGLQSSVLGTHQSLGTQSGDELSAVDESETLLSAQMYGSQVVHLDQFGSGLDGQILGIPSLAFSNQTKTQMSERSEIARSAHSSLQRDHRHDASVKEV